MATRSVRAIDRFRLVSADAVQLARFYVAAFDARVLGRERHAPEPVESARTVTLALGDECIELVTFDQPGAPYPADAIASDIMFQHVALVVTDIGAAYSQLCAIEGWKPITRRGPQRLPANTGGVTAFKFRDPEGHPVELIEFRREATPARWRRPAASRIVLGIDHTAISVSDVAASIAFYEALGLHAGARSTNSGPEQDLLDGIDDTRAEVIALMPLVPTPHVELLCYAARRRATAAESHDIAATQVVFSAAGPVSLALRDPDAHHLFLSATR